MTFFNIKTAIIGFRSLNPKIYKSIRRNIPKGFEVEKIIGISTECTAIIGKGFRKDTFHEIVSFFRENNYRIANLPRSFKFITIYPDEGKVFDFSKLPESLVIPISNDGKSSLRENLNAELFKTDREKPTMVITLCHNSPSALLKLEHRMRSIILKEANPLSYYSRRIMELLQRRLPEQQIKSIIDSLPEEIMKTYSDEYLALIAEAMFSVRHNDPCGISIRRHRKEGVFLADIFLVLPDYFGLSHDITSVLKNTGLIPIDMDFYLLKNDKNKTLCICTARFKDSADRPATLKNEILSLLNKDRIKRSNFNEGEKLWFSFGNLLHSFAKLYQSINHGFKMEEIIGILQKYHPISKEIITLIRIKADRVYYTEGLNSKEIETSTRNKIKALKDEDGIAAEVLDFFLDFALSIKKTDYFDFDRPREFICTHLDGPILLRNLPVNRTIIPSEIFYNYEINGEVHLKPIFPMQIRESGERYIEVGEITPAAPSLFNIIKEHASIYENEFTKIARNMLPNSLWSNLNALSLLESMRFIDLDKEGYGIRKLNQQDYFAMVTKALFHPVENDGLEHLENIYLFDIARKLGIAPPDIKRIEVRFLGEGNNKYVSRIVLHATNTSKHFVVGIQRFSTAKEDSFWDEHCFSEYRSLRDSHQLTSLIPVPFGFMTMRQDKISQNVIYKEYIRGQDCRRYLAFLKNKKKIPILYNNIGITVGQLYRETGKCVLEIKPENVVTFNNFIRFCDVVPLDDEFGEVAQGFKYFCQDYLPPENLHNFLSGVLSGAGEEAGRDLLGRIRFNLGYDVEDAWMSRTFIKQLDDFARSIGKDPDEFYRFDVGYSPLNPKK